MKRGLTREQVQLLKEDGSEISVPIAKVSDLDRQQRRLDRGGDHWALAPKPSTILKAETGVSKTQTRTYRSMMGGAESQSVTVTPYFSRATLLYGGVEAGQAGSSTGAPGVIFMQTGESAQSKANEMQRPDPEFFARMDLPEPIFDLAKCKGLGVQHRQRGRLDTQLIRVMPQKILAQLTHATDRQEYEKG